MEELTQAVERIINFYLSNGCPCRFPRFRAIAEFDFRTQPGLSPHTTHETDLLTTRGLDEARPVYRPAGEWEDDNRPMICTACGSRAILHSTQYNINMWCVFLAIQPKLPDLGGPALSPLPLFRGPYGFNHPGDDEILDTLFTQLDSLTAFEEHMTELG
jgi:hypothetical protein